MKCPICNEKTKKVLKIIKKVRIYECSGCQLGLIEQNFLSKVQILPSDRKKLYDFESYKRNEEKYRKRFENLTKLISYHKTSGKILDIGAGFGLFSSILQSKENYKIELIEPRSPPQYISKFMQSVYKTTFEKFIGTKNKFDVIIMMDVLEHFIDPLINLKKVRWLLKEDGILVIQTPNYKSLMARICRDWAWWMIEDHKFFFSPKSLRLMLKKTGFRIGRFMTYEDWEDFKKNLDGNFVGFKTNILRKIIKGLFFIFFIPFYFLTRKLLWRANLGGLMFMVARKAD